MMEMYRRASSESPKETHKEENEAEKKSLPEEKEESQKTETTPEPEQKPEYEPESDSDNESEQQEEQTDFSVCSTCAGGIALCSFLVESTSDAMPIENAQILLHRNDGLFIRALTDEKGETPEIPVFADAAWRVSITAQGYISVSHAQIEPKAGEKITVPVHLDESISLGDVFAENRKGMAGA